MHVRCVLLAIHTDISSETRLSTREAITSVVPVEAKRGYQWHTHAFEFKLR